MEQQLPAHSRWSRVEQTWRRGTGSTCAALRSEKIKTQIKEVIEVTVDQTDQRRWSDHTFPTFDCSGKPMRMTIRWSAMWEPASRGMGMQEVEPWCRAQWVREPSSSQDSWRMWETHSMNSFGLYWIEICISENMTLCVYTKQIKKQVINIKFSIICCKQLCGQVHFFLTKNTCLRIPYLVVVVLWPLGSRTCDKFLGYFWMSTHNICAKLSH